MTLMTAWEVAGEEQNHHQWLLAAGCSLETTDISEVSLYIIEDEARSIGHLAETSCLLAGHYHPLYRNHPTTTPLRIETALSITSLRIKASTSNCDHSNK